MPPGKSPVPPQAGGTLLQRQSIVCRAPPARDQHRRRGRDRVELAAGAAQHHSHHGGLQGCSNLDPHDNPIHIRLIKPARASCRACREKSFRAPYRQVLRSSGSRSAPAGRCRVRSSAVPHRRRPHPAEQPDGGAAGIRAPDFLQDLDGLETIASGGWWSRDPADHSRPRHLRALATAPGPWRRPDPATAAHWWPCASYTGAPSSRARLEGRLRGHSSRDHGFVWCRPGPPRHPRQPWWAGVRGRA